MLQCADACCCWILWQLFVRPPSPPHHTHPPTPPHPRLPLAGGEFFGHLKTLGKLGEEAARVYAGEVLLMFEHLHAKDIVYRDLKVR